MEIGNENGGPNCKARDPEGADSLDLNTITEPKKIISTMSKADSLGTDFTRTYPPYLASVLILKGK
jgi:hypothetical protein